MVLARDIIPILNVAFVFSTLVTVLMSLVVIPYGKRRALGKSLSWGEAMVSSLYGFFVMFLAYGVVPHQFLTHADNELRWRKDKLLFGPGGILKPKSLGGWFPMTLNYESILRDNITVVIYLAFLGLHIYLWLWWQNRGKPKASTKALLTSNFGRPLVKKS